MTAISRIVATGAISVGLLASCKPHLQDSPGRTNPVGREQMFCRFVRSLLPPAPPGAHREIRMQTPFDSSNGTVNDYRWAVLVAPEEQDPPTSIELEGYVRFKPDGYIDMFTAVKGSDLPVAQMDEVRKQIALRGSADFSHISAVYPPNREAAMADRVRNFQPRLEAFIGHRLGAPTLAFRTCAPGRGPGVCEPQGTWEASYTQRMGPRGYLLVVVEFEPINGELLSISVI
jgi:hypothetical protein